MERYGGEALAHMEVARKFGVKFACACGPCDAESDGPQARHWATGWTGFNPFFRVVSLDAGAPGHTGFLANETMVERFLIGHKICKNYRLKSAFRLSTASALE